MTDEARVRSALCTTGSELAWQEPVRPALFALAMGGCSGNGEGAADG